MPFFVSIKYNSEIYKITLNDLRNDEEKDSDPIPEVDPKISQELKDAILLERYDMQFFVDSDVNQIRSNSRKTSQTSVIKEDYSYPALFYSRQWFNIIDNWVKKYDVASDKRFIKKDGKDLCELFKRKEKENELNLGVRIAAKLCACEMKIRLKEVKNG